ncbi:unnamed protein product [Ilex paraguariensis]|uniref:DUF4378 domain-containing protein n=1 Tax=Ilex paraguariensis TaxID=185542 RepID=A0ABC8TTI1_9AQUA
MSQDSHRSVRYRSFLTCDDPKGVVECRTIRKSKTDIPKMEIKVESRGMQKDSSTPSSLNLEKRKDKVSNKGSTEELHNPSSFQLMEVCRGAQKLNQVIDSWSKRTSYEEKPKDIAKDLLKGALDLQESLIMLGKLQEASQYMAKLKKKQKEKGSGGTVDEVGIERTNSNRRADAVGIERTNSNRRADAVGIERTNSDRRDEVRIERNNSDRRAEVGIERTNSTRFRDRNYIMEYQEPRLSVDGSSRDCYEELRKAIRDGLAKQNLLPKDSSEEKEFDRRKLETSPDNLYISSSQSSMDHSHEFTSSDCSSSKVQQEKPKGSNLIAKLMGLEEIPSKPLQSTSQKQLERDNILSQRRQIFDIDKPKARKPHFVVEKVDPKRRTLEEIIETMQFKGLLKSNSANGLKHQTHCSNISDLREWFVDDAPPIVLIKPLNVPCLEAEEPHTDKFAHDERALDTEEKLTKGKAKQKFSPQTIDHWDKALNSHEMLMKPQAGKTPIKRLSQEKGGTNHKDVIAKQHDRKVKTKKALSSTELKASTPVSSNLQKKEPNEKKIDKIQKAAPGGRKPLELENMNSKGVSKHLDQGKVTSMKVRRPENRSNISKNGTPQQKNATPNSTAKRRTATVSHNSCNQKKNVKNEKKVSEPFETNVENIGCHTDEMRIDLNCENESDMVATNKTPAVQLLTDEGADASETLNKENCGNIQNSPCEAALLTPQHESNTFTGEADCCITQHETEKKSDQSRSNERDLLLSSASFISDAEELFDITVCKPLIFPASLQDSDIANTRNLLDCANELLEHKSLQCPQIIHPLLRKPIKNSRIYISLDLLVEEVCDEIESLRGYSMLAEKRLPVDTVNVVVERDLLCKAVVSGAWGMGWRNGFTSDEVGQVEVEIGKLIISELIEELLTDFVL